jgi:hypothetical protein
MSVELLSNEGLNPLRCRLFGHKWRTFDAGWCGKDYQTCQRISFTRFRICGAVRSIASGNDGGRT